MTGEGGRERRLDRHAAPEPGVLGAVNLAHPAGAEPLGNAVVQQALSDSNRHERPGYYAITGRCTE